MALQCEDLIRRQLGRGMTEEEILDMAQEGNRLAAQAQANLNAQGLQADVARYARQWAARKKLAAVAKQRNSQLQAAARLRIVDYAKSNFSGMEWEGLSALMVGGKYMREGGRLSVDSMRCALEGRYIGGLLVDLEQVSPAFVKLLRDDQFCRSLADNLWKLDKKGAALSGPQEARDMAKVLHKWQDVAREDENSAGAWINKISGYICRQSHDAAKIKAAGYQEWKRFIETRLDWDKTADGRIDPKNAAEVDKFLSEVYTGFVTGMHERFAPPGQQAHAPLASAHNMGSVAARASKQRVLHFKEGTDWFDYNARFGRGPMIEAVLAGLKKSADDTALMRVFGPAPMENLEGAIKDIKLAWRQQLDDVSIKKMNAFGTRLRNQMAELDGSLNTEGNPSLSMASRCIRSLESMAKLGGALISGFSDIPLFAQEMKYQGRSYFASMAEGLSLFVKGRGSAEERRVLAQCGVFFDSMSGALTSRFIGNDLPGKLSAMMNTFFKLNGLNFWTDAWRKSACLMMAHDLADLSTLAFDQLSKPRQRALSLYKIDEGIWEMLRHGKKTAADGRAYLTPEAASSIKAADIEAYLKSKGQLAGPGVADSFRSEIAERLRAYYRDRVQYAVLEPDARTASILHQGTSSGTVAGEAMRFVMQFKSFPVAFLQRTFSRELYGRGADTALKGVARSLIPKDGELGGLCGMILATTMFGYLSMTTKALLAGRTPRDFTESPEAFGKVLMAAFVQGGGAGLYGDFLLGEKSRMGDDFLASLAGPTLGTASSLVSLYKAARDGEDVSSTAFYTLWGCVPGNNLFWTKSALDHMLLYSVREWLNPGSVRRMRRRMERETNQSFYIEPTIWDWAR